MSQNVKVIALHDVPPIELPNDSWSKILVNQERVDGNRSAIGYSVFTPGTATADLSHETEELAYVVKGRGELRLQDRTLPFAAGDALYVPAGAWHVVANTGDEDVEMVFASPTPTTRPPIAAAFTSEGVDDPRFRKKPTEAVSRTGRPNSGQ